MKMKTKGKFYRIFDLDSYASYKTYNFQRYSSEYLTNSSLTLPITLLHTILSSAVSRHISLLMSEVTRDATDDKKHSHFDSSISHYLQFRNVQLSSLSRRGRKELQRRTKRRKPVSVSHYNYLDQERTMCRPVTLQVRKKVHQRLIMSGNKISF